MKTASDIYDCIVIGGGASGMMAAATAAHGGGRVLLLEKNKTLGEKLKITGGGRCNITHAEYNTRSFLKYFGPAEDFLYSAFSQFGVTETFSYFESRGLPLVVQARERVFPHTEKALDVYKVLEKDLQKNKVVVKVNSTVKKILHDKKNILGVETRDGILSARSYILATGGMSHPETGSTGDGFAWLRELGHTVKNPTPTIVPLAVEDAWIKILAGVSLTFMKITFFLDGKKQFSKKGKILFTHFGLSGPLILNSAGAVGELLRHGTVEAHIDAFPDTDFSLLEARIIKIFDSNKNKILHTVLKEIVPAGTTKGIAMLLSDMDFTKKVHSITKEERKRIVHLLKALPLTITDLMGYDRAVVADGGVTLTEIDTRTMQSKLIKNLFITGDLLHINRPTGGQSLQLCWTTGYVAGKAATRSQK